MFTGLIEDIGTVESTASRGSGLRLAVRTNAIDAKTLAMGESISIDGYCQTVVEIGAHGFSVDVGRETLAKTTAGKLRAGHRINLERAVRLGDRLGGHWVAGHVDGVGEVSRVERSPDFVVFHVEAPPEVARYLIPKGSIAMQGVSLTVNTCDGSAFSVGIIPHTLAQTTLSDLREGSPVNLEADIIGKYVEKLVNAAQGRETDGVTREFLAKHGFA
ncbi:MAG: riboflavin synthase [Deltaproteobacteria bacterium]|nr:riboflavin synthase [Deltaproteobacteria bacterium]